MLVSLTHRSYVQEINSFLVKIAACFPNLEYFSFLKNPACYNPLTGGSEEDYQKYRSFFLLLLLLLMIVVVVVVGSPQKTQKTKQK
jgi:hypothetical protein